MRINAGDTMEEFTVRMSPADGIREWPYRENMDIKVLDDPAYTVGVRLIVQAIGDDRRLHDGTIRVAGTSATSTVHENAGFVDVKFRLEPDPHAFRVRRSFALEGSSQFPKATNGVDYRLEGPMYVEFPPLVRERTVRFRILDDKRVEGERFTVPEDEDAIAYAEGFVIHLGLEDSDVLTNDTEGRSAEVYILDDDNAPLVMSADNVTEGQSIRVRIGVDPAAGGCHATFPFLVDLSVVSQTQGTLEGSRRTGNTLGPTVPQPRTVRLESCADTAIETFQSVENTTDEGERAATFRLSNLRRASATNPPAGNPLRVEIADGIESVSVYDNDASPSDYVAVTDYAHVPPGTQSIDIDVLENDFVRNSRKDAVSITWASEPPNGSIAITREWITYTPDEGFSGRDGFVYRVDAEGLQSTGLVQVDVQGDDEPGWVATWTGTTTMTEGGTGLTVTVTNQNTESTRTVPAYVNVKVRSLDAGAGPSDLEVVQKSMPSDTVLTDRLLGTTSRETGSGSYIGNYGGAISIVAKTDSETEYTERMVLELFAEGRRVNNGQREIVIANQQGAVPNAPTVNVTSATRNLEMNEGDSRTFQIELSEAAASDLDVNTDGHNGAAGGSESAAPNNDEEPRQGRG